MQRYGALQRQGRWRREAVWGTVKEKRLACQVRDGVVEGGGDWSQGNSSDILCSPDQPPNIPATSHIPMQGCSGWDQDGEAEVKGCTPAGRGPEICSQGQWLWGQDGSRISIPGLPHSPAPEDESKSKKEKGTTRPPPTPHVPLPCQGPREGGWAKIRNLKDWPWAGLRVQQTLGPLGSQAKPTLTKQLSIEQETRAVRLMVAGGLGQRTCPRSRCAARQCRAPAASRLRCLPGAAAAAKRRARWQQGLRATPARLSPTLHNGASPAPPSRTSAEGRGET